MFRYSWRMCGSNLNISNLILFVYLFVYYSLEYIFLVYVIWIEFVI